jgi:hypothetical protein
VQARKVTTSCVTVRILTTRRGRTAHPSPAQGLGVSTADKSKLPWADAAGYRWSNPLPGIRSEKLRVSPPGGAPEGDLSVSGPWDGAYCSLRRALLPSRWLLPSYLRPALLSPRLYLSVNCLGLLTGMTDLPCRL